MAIRCARGRQAFTAYVHGLTPGFPDQRTSEIATTFADMERRYANNELGVYQHGKHGWPGWEYVRTRMYIVEQEVRCSLVLPQPGQTIFVPSNWYHEVENLTDCLSVRTPNLHSSTTTGAMLIISKVCTRLWSRRCVAKHMLTQMDDVAAALDDVRDMLKSQSMDASWQAEFAAIVQDVVKEDAGWAWEGFWRMVEHNLEHPACDESCRAGNTKPLIRALLKRFAARPETPWLITSTHTQAPCWQRVAARVDAPCIFPTGAPS